MASAPRAAVAFLAGTLATIDLILELAGVLRGWPS
jgi:hypothetical protein